MSRALLDFVLARISDAAEGVRVLEFRSPSGATLPAAAAGSHIELHLPKGLVRDYSLLDAHDAPESYRIAVKRDPASRGGSRWLHEAPREGFRFLIGAPECSFPLDEGAAHSVLIAGGIGIAPIRCMALRLAALGRTFELHYAAKSRAEAAFAEELAAYACEFYFDDDALGMEAVVAAAPADAQLYCCGPRALMQAFERATTSRDPSRVHTEYFFPRHEPRLGGFTVELARSQRRIAVPPGRTILDTLLAAGVNVPYACLEGICGRCEVRVLEGAPDHRDSYLAATRREHGGTMMLCCSGALGERLVLDI